MKTMRERIRLRNIEVARFPTAKRIRIIATRTIFLGYDNDGKSVNGAPGDCFSVPEDLSRESATKLLIAGFAEPASNTTESKRVLPPQTTDRDRNKLKLREVIEPIEMIRIVSAGIRSSENAFFLGNSDGVSLTGSVGDTFSIKDGEMSEELALKLIKKGYAEKAKPGILKRLIKKFD